MESTRPGDNENWLKDFIASAVGELGQAESKGTSTPMPPTWTALVEGPSPGEVVGAVGPYRIAKRLGRGGMGVVFEAFDSTLRRVVAIKFLSPRLGVSSLARARFTREAQAAAAMNHPNIVTIHAVGEHEGLPYLVMEYVAGITLAERVNQDGMLQLKSILRIGIQIASGLAAAHAQGLIHRDIKPANILLERNTDRVKITDFGLACITSEPWRLTASGVLLGTPSYMSPEQANAAALDQRSDLFSLGSVLYHLCTGEPPFPGPSITAILAGVREREPRPIRDLNPDIPPPLEGIIRRLMSKIPADRFATADELAGTLVDYLAQTQGKKLDHVFDGPLHELNDRALASTPDQAGKFEILDDGEFGLDPRTRAKYAIASRVAAWWSRLARPARTTIIALAATAGLAAIAVTLAQWFWETFSADTPVVLLLAGSGLAVLGWCYSQILSALKRHVAGKRPMGRRLALLRNLLATTAVLAASGTLYIEWSAHAQANRALRAIAARRKEKPQTPLTRAEVDALVRCAGENTDWTEHDGLQRATYRWKGVFRTYLLHADYTHFRSVNGRWKPRNETTGSDVLAWINDVLE